MWKLQETDAVYEVQHSEGTVRGRLNLLRPHHGLTDVRWNDTALETSVLQLHLPGTGRDADESLADAYVREPDLIATYESTGERDVRPQIYWRDLSTSVPSPMALEVWVSVETGLLASHPSTGLATVLPGRDVWVGRDGSEHLEPLNLADDRPQQWTADDAPHFLLFRFNEQPITYVEMIYPSDCAGVSVLREGEGATRWSFAMFPSSLEKGVIRRARVRAFLLPRVEDERAARHLFEDFLATAPPLTA